MGDPGVLDPSRHEDRLSHLTSSSSEDPYNFLFPVSGDSTQPLFLVQTRQERLYQVSQIIERVAACILDFGDSGQRLELFDVMEPAGRLDVAVQAIRWENGASD